jgi:hypothetical protein
VNPRLFVDVDPRTLHLPTMQLSGADPFQTSPAHRTALSSQVTERFRCRMNISALSILFFV